MKNELSGIIVRAAKRLEWSYEASFTVGRLQTPHNDSAVSSRSANRQGSIIPVLKKNYHSLKFKGFHSATGEIYSPSRRRPLTAYDVDKNTR